MEYIRNLLITIIHPISELMPIKLRAIMLLQSRAPSVATGASNRMQVAKEVTLATVNYNNQQTMRNKEFNTYDENDD